VELFGVIYALLLILILEDTSRFFSFTRSITEGNNFIPLLSLFFKFSFESNWVHGFPQFSVSFSYIASLDQVSFTMLENEYDEYSWNRFDY